MNAPVKSDAWKLDPVRDAQLAKSIRESITAAYGEDDDLVWDTIEGETGLLEIIDKLLVRRAENLAMAEALSSVLDDLKARKDRFKKRAEIDKAIIEQAFLIGELPKRLERPSATLTMADRTPSLQVLEESDIPAEYWKTGDPVLDKRALTDALKVRAKALASLPEDPTERQAAIAELPPEIPGACLSNGAPSLTVRAK